MWKPWTYTYIKITADVDVKKFKHSSIFRLLQREKKTDFLSSAESKTEEKDISIFLT